VLKKDSVDMVEKAKDNQFSWEIPRLYVIFIFGIQIKNTSVKNS